MSEGYEIDFLTLTSNQDLDARGTLYAWPKDWAKLRTRMYREVGQFPYLLVPERHLDGRLHIHAIECANLGTRWYKDNAPECGLGYIAEESEVRSPAGAAWYVSKYISKSLEFTKWPEHFRRVRTSQNWPKMPALPAPENWEFSVMSRQESLLDESEKWRSEGYTINITEGQSAWAWISGSQ